MHIFYSGIRWPQVFTHPDLSASNQSDLLNTSFVLLCPLSVSLRIQEPPQPSDPQKRNKIKLRLRHRNPAGHMGNSGEVAPPLAPSASNAPSASLVLSASSSTSASSILSASISPSASSVLSASSAPSAPRAPSASSVLSASSAPSASRAPSASSVLSASSAPSASRAPSASSAPYASRAPSASSALSASHTTQSQSDPLGHSQPDTDGGGFLMPLRTTSWRPQNRPQAQPQHRPKAQPQHRPQAQPQHRPQRMPGSDEQKAFEKAKRKREQYDREVELYLLDHNIRPTNRLGGGGGGRGGHPLLSISSSNSV